MGEHVRRLLPSTFTLYSYQQQLMADEAEHREGRIGEKARTQDVVVDVLLDSDSAERSASSRDEEIRLVRKLDRRIMPMLCIMYLFAGEF